MQTADQSTSATPMQPRQRSALARPHGSRFDTRIVIFAVYSILYEIIIWGLFGWAVFVRGESGWWILAAAYLSSAQLKPRHFGIPEKNSANAQSVKTATSL
jgi:hypothetical protein